MVEQPRWPREGWVALVAGIAWLAAGASGGVADFLLGLVPGALLAGAGAGLLFWSGDRRIPQTMALAGLVGVVLSIPGLFVIGWLPGLALAALSAAATVAAGAASVRQEPRHDQVPEPVPSWQLAAQVALDDALLAHMHFSISLPPGEFADTVLREVRGARELFEARGWLEKPEAYHELPPSLDAPRVEAAKTLRVEFEHVSFESGYEPRGDEPGRDRWVSYEGNRTAHAWVKRHSDRDRPWLICIHGYQMGLPWMDWGAFDPRVFHERMGLNLLLPVLPLHGARRIGRTSGDGFLSGNVLDSVHAEAQAMWDIRRLLSWVRQQTEAPVGVYGLSLGGYNTALLASLDEDLACAIPGIPATDVSRLVWRHGPPLQLRYMEHLGVERSDAAEVLRVVSPLATPPKVPREHRLIFGGVADRLVPPDQVRDLWEHWERPEMIWYQGAHLTFPLDARIRRAVGSTLQSAGLEA
ncbi:MAG: S9 family peptidase [Proteobacteria bacterium]|nr:S9 family peptidase [Pseudomonadota bacterium]